MCSPSWFLIIGNPPYIHYNRLSVELRDVVSNLIGTREADIYYAFIRKAIDLMEMHSELVYIVPYHFLYNKYAMSIRKYLLQNGAFKLFIDLGEARLFHDVSPETVIFKWQKGALHSDIEVLRLTKVHGITIEQITDALQKALYTKSSNDLCIYYTIPHFKDIISWSIHKSEKHSSHSVPLHHIARVGVGLVSGYDKAFIVPQQSLTQYCPKCGVTMKCPFLQPFAKAKHCEPYKLTGLTYYLLIPDSVQNENELKERCAVLVNQLWDYKKMLCSRYLPQGKQWFHWQSLRNYTFIYDRLDEQRIYVPTLDRRSYNRFAIGSPGVWPAGDVVFIQPYDKSHLMPLAEYLNSESFRNKYLQLGYKRGGRIVFTQSLLNSIIIDI